MNGKYLTLIGAALTLALTSNVAVAESAKLLISQSSGDPSSRQSGEIKLSPRVNKEKFCKDYPLNSRCQGSSASTSSPSGSSTETPKKPSDSNPGGTATPGLAPADPGTTGIPGGQGTTEVAPPPGGNPTTPGRETQTTPPGGTGDVPTTPPGGTTGAPDSNTPGGTAVPGTAPADPGTTNTPGGSTEIAPPPTGNPSNSGSRRDPDAITPSGSPGSGTQK